MKKHLLFTIFLISFGSITIAQDTLPNPNFEQWIIAPSGLYEEPEGDVWATPNPSVDALPFPPSINPVERSTDAYSGNFAAKLESIDIFGFLVPGSLYTGIFDFNILDPLSSIQFGSPFNGKPDRLKAAYKYTPVMGDSLGIFFYLLSGNAGAPSDTVAKLEFVSTATTTNYVLFDMPINYLNPSLDVDSIQLIFTANAGAANLAGQIGSTLLVDDVELVYTTTDLVSVLLPEISVQTYPNPAIDQLSVQLSEPIQRGIIQIFDIQGQLFRTLPLQPSTTSISLEGFPLGSYHYVLRNAEHKPLYSGIFIKQ